MIRRFPLLAALCNAATLALAGLAAAQAPPDSSVVVQDTVVVSSTKLRSRLSELALSANVLTSAWIRLGTARHTQDVLAGVPGVNVADLTGSESGGVVEARGYASQGTSSHMLVLVDEVPVNEFESDRVDWNLIAPEQIERIEFLRGPAAFLYGNASMAGVVNVVTHRPDSGTRAWAEANGGSAGRVGVSGGASWGGTRLETSVSGVHRDLDGYRDNSGFRSTGGYGFARAGLGGSWALRARAFGQHAKQELPGPLPDPQWRTDPKSASTPLDQRTHDRFGGALELNGFVGRGVELVGIVSGDGVNSEATETIIPAGTMDRTGDSRSGRAELRAHWTPRLAWVPHVLVGGEVLRGSLESRYHDPGAGGALVGAGDVRRLAGGVFALAQLRPVERVTLTGGVRLDWLRSSLDDPTDGAPRGPDDDLRAASPTAGLNLALARGGNAYLMYAGSFKAPNLEQLYDQRPYDIDGPGGIPPLHITNAAIQPQRGDHVEAGLRSLLGARLSGDAAVYYARSRDEIGFDLANFRLSNIDKSIHYGFEGRLAVAPTGGLSGQAAYAYTRAEFDGGDHDGKQINTVPEHQVSGRLTAQHPWAGTVTVEEIGVLRQWLDEDNRYPLDDYWVTHLGVTQDLGVVHLFGSVRNLFDRRYATLGYVTIDPFTGGDLPLRFPASGRSFAAGLRVAMHPR